MSEDEMSDMSQEERYQKKLKKIKVEKLNKKNKDKHNHNDQNNDSDSDSQTEEILDHTWEHDEEQKDKVLNHHIKQERQKSLIDSVFSSENDNSYSDVSDHSESDYNADTDVLQQPEVDELMETAFIQFAAENSKKTNQNNASNESTDEEDFSSDPMEMVVRELSEEQTKKIDMEFDLSVPEIFEQNDLWDNYHLKMPCSKHHTTKIRKNKNVPKWPIIQNALTSEPIISSNSLIQAIKEYCPFTERWSGLEAFLDLYLSDLQFEKFFCQILPDIIRLALRLPELFSEPLPLLIPGKAQEIILSQLQIASLLANGFLCTWPTQGGPIKVETNNNNNSDEGSSSSKPKTKRVKYPSVNFERLYQNSTHQTQNEKLMCVYYYFEAISDRLKKKNTVWKYLSFSKVLLGTTPDWEKSKTVISPKKITTSDSAMIEDLGSDFLQADFANRFIGGGVLGRGCIQEEIRFLINFECIASLLFTAKMEDDEVVYIKGAERFSDYSGYSYTFKCEGRYVDKTKSHTQNGKNFLDTEIVAFDALYFGMDPDVRITQYAEQKLCRELQKAYLAFSQPASQTKKQIATGNWGCGAFGGYHDLKAIIQIIAAVELDIPITYCTFGVKGLAACLNEFIELASEKKVSVGFLWEKILSLSREIEQSEANEMPQLFTYLIEIFE